MPSLEAALRGAMKVEGVHLPIPLEEKNCSGQYLALSTRLIEGLQVLFSLSSPEKQDLPPRHLLYPNSLLMRP